MFSKGLLISGHGVLEGLMGGLEATGHCHHGLLCGLKTLEAIAEVVLGELDVVFPVRRRVLSGVGLLTGLA